MVSTQQEGERKRERERDVHDTMRWELKKRQAFETQNGTNRLVCVSQDLLVFASVNLVVVSVCLCHAPVCLYFFFKYACP